MQSSWQGHSASSGWGSLAVSEGSLWLCRDWLRSVAKLLLREG